MPKLDNCKICGTLMVDKGGWNSQVCPACQPEATRRDMESYYASGGTNYLRWWFSVHAFFVALSFSTVFSFVGLLGFIDPPFTWIVFLIFFGCSMVVVAELTVGLFIDLKPLDRIWVACGYAFLLIMADTIFLDTSVLVWVVDVFFRGNGLMNL